MADPQSTEVRLGPSQYLSLLLLRRTKEPLESEAAGRRAEPGCGADSGRLIWNTWSATEFVSSVPFTTGTEGYACFKIPALLSTARGSLLAFAEARKPSCGDFDETELVMKRSTDGGETWSDLMVVVNVSEAEKEAGLCGHRLVIGNAAPVQLRLDSKFHPGRILLPYTRNNFKTWLTFSDDDGLTWTGDRELPSATLTAEQPDCSRNMSYFGLRVDRLRLDSLDDFYVWLKELCAQKSPFSTFASRLSGPWQFVETGPPGSLQLASGRVLVPGFHSYVRGLDPTRGILPVSQLYNNLGFGHAIISDDDGDTWRLGRPWPRAPHGGNEHQFVQLRNGSVLTNMRSFSTGSPQWRVQARSDDEGETFTETSLVTGQPEPFNGCQGSIFSTRPDTVFVASPDPPPASSFLQDIADELECSVNLTGRHRLTVWKSTDGGTTYPQKMVIDPGLSAQTSLQESAGRLVMLYEQADDEPETPSGMILSLLIRDMFPLIPSRFVFREVPTASSGPSSSLPGSTFRE